MFENIRGFMVWFFWISRNLDLWLLARASYLAGPGFESHQKRKLDFFFFFLL